MIEIPEPVAAYLREPAVQQSVDILLNAPEFEPDVRGDDIAQFATARHAAETVRFELWRLLWSTWQATWGSALKQAAPGALPYKLKEFEHEEAKPLPDRVWRLGILWMYHSIGAERRLWTGVELDRKQGRLRLLVETAYFPDDSSEAMLAALPAGHWSEPPSAADHICVTSAVGVEIPSEGSALNLGILPAVATDAVEALRSVS